MILYVYKLKGTKIRKFGQFINDYKEEQQK